MLKGRSERASERERESRTESVPSMIELPRYSKLTCSNLKVDTAFHDLVETA